MTETWIILGATSSLARAFARQVSADGAGVLLCGRDLEDMQATASDCAMRGAPVAEALSFDARTFSSFSAIRDRAIREDGQLHVAVFVGSMPPQSDIDEAPQMVDGVIQDSFVGPASFLQLLAPELEARGGAKVVGVGSVAGDRGRIGNYVYGSAKAGFHTYLAGLRNRLTRAGGQVLTVKPGFSDTAMTWGLEGMFLVATPDRVASDILRALKRNRDILYTPFFWRYIMAIIKAIPERVFKKLSV